MQHLWEMFNFHVKFVGMPFTEKYCSRPQWTRRLRWISMKPILTYGEWYCSIENYWRRGKPVESWRTVKEKCLGCCQKHIQSWSILWAYCTIASISDLRGSYPLFGKSSGVHITLTRLSLCFSGNIQLNLFFKINRLNWTIGLQTILHPTYKQSEA